MFRLKKFDTVSSTNDVIRAAIKDEEPEGLAVIASQQTGGYGRQGRSWASPIGGMYLSVLLRPDCAAEQLPSLSLTVGIAVRRALLSILSRFAQGQAKAEDILLKWPNDVVFGKGVPFRKLCGISLELIDGAVCVGIGVNVFPPERSRVSHEGLAIGNRNIPVYLADICELGGARGISELHSGSAGSIGSESARGISEFCGDSAGSIGSDDASCSAGSCSAEDLAVSESDELSVECVADAVLRELDVVYNLWRPYGFAVLSEEYESCSALQGRFVAIEARDGSLMCEGRVQGIDGLGRLVILTRDGKTIEVASGEAHIRQAEHSG